MLTSDGNDGCGVRGQLAANGLCAGFDLGGDGAYPVGLVEGGACPQGIGGDELHPGLADFKSRFDIEDEVDRILGWVYDLAVESFAVF